MTRLVLEKGDQQRFIEEVKDKSGLTWVDLAKQVEVCGRTLRDWRREKFLISRKALLKFSDLYKIQIPRIKETRREYWSAYKEARNGAYARLRIYGPPGTLEGRRKGGLVSQRLRRQNPELYRLFSCRMRKKIVEPDYSSKLAEAFGIILGDGGITASQVTISLNFFKDKEYSFFVKKLLERLFGVEVKHYKRRDSNVMILRMTGVNLVEFLVKRGFFIGDKIKRQVGVPSWIKQKSSYRSACLRGLMDTDGGVFDHRYKVRGKGYQYKKICFVNRSLPILNFVKEEFENIGLNPKMRNKRSVWLYSENEVLKYMQLVGSHNKRLLEKFLGGVHRTGKVAPC